ncbi:hypothetical protein WJX74_005466 [Apatococcus lobatus]|uniref:RNA methyltransferase n=1 Tax=Apatococcus lobatus TaxID=904363 RepID=A0AAW1S3J2_9CHLO
MRPELTSLLLSAEPSSLTANQRKKRRQKLSKQGKSGETASTEFTGAESSTAAQTAFGSASLGQGFAPGASEAASDNLQASSFAPFGTEALSPPAAFLRQQRHQDGSQPQLDRTALGCCGSALLQPAGPVCRQDLSGAAALLLEHENETIQEALTQSKQEKEPKPAGPAGLFVHGNYSSYYSRRFGEDLGDDPRLEILDKRWFRNKRCMDIGCNDGRLTLTMASKFGSASMLGLDIDASLIKQACRCGRSL